MKALALLAVAATVVACDTTPTAPSTRPQAPINLNATIVENDRFDVVTSIVNSCDNSPVDLELTFHNVFSITLDAAGGRHVNVHQNINGQGVNTVTGVKYVWNGVYNESQTVEVGAERTVSFRDYLISQGGGDNLVLLEKFHLTFTPNGEITSYGYEFEVECRA